LGNTLTTLAISSPGVESTTIYSQLKEVQFWPVASGLIGHIISGLGVTVDLAKVMNVVEWPVPRNVKGVRDFLGLTGYYRKFIKDYWKMAKPLTELTKKEGFHLGPKQQLLSKN